MAKTRNFQPTNSFPVQARAGDGRGKCSSCRIEYPVDHGRVPVCPLCEKIHEVESLRQQIGDMALEAQMLKSDLERAEVRSDLVGTLRESLNLADPEDLAMLKAIAYRWRAEQDTFHVTVVRRLGRLGRRSVLEIRPGHDREREYFEPTSVGGVAFVDTYEDLVKAQGHVPAMQHYARAIAGRLTS